MSHCIEGWLKLLEKIASNKPSCKYAQKCRRADAVCAVLRLTVLIFCQHTRKYCFFAFCCKNWHIYSEWIDVYPLSLKDGQTYFWILFHTILRQISNYRFCAFSSRELSVFAIFYAFYNYADKLRSHWKVEILMFTKLLCCKIRSRYNWWGML